MTTWASRPPAMEATACALTSQLDDVFSTNVSSSLSAGRAHDRPTDLARSLFGPNLAVTGT